MTAKICRLFHFASHFIVVDSLCFIIDSLHKESAPKPTSQLSFWFFNWKLIQWLAISNDLSRASAVIFHGPFCFLVGFCCRARSILGRVVVHLLPVSLFVDDDDDDDDYDDDDIKFRAPEKYRWWCNETKINCKRIILFATCWAKRFIFIVLAWEMEAAFLLITVIYPWFECQLFPVVFIRVNVIPHIRAGCQEKYVPFVFGFALAVIKQRKRVKSSINLLSNG